MCVAPRGGFAAPWDLVELLVPGEVDETSRTQRLGRPRWAADPQQVVAFAGVRAGLTEVVDFVPAGRGLLCLMRSR